MSMNILITGGTGLIGRALSTALLDDGHSVTVLTRDPEKRRGGLPSGVIPVRWDGHSPEGWSHLIDETDAVINLAGQSIAGESLLAILTRRWTEEQKNRIKQSRVDAGQALVAAIRMAKKKPGVFIQASAVGYYGPRGNEDVPESAEAGTDYLADVCRAWEDSTLEVEQMGIRRAIIRLGLVFAPIGGILPIMLLPFRLFVGGPLGTGKQIVSWIHIQDLVHAFRFLLENQDAFGAFNLSTPNPVSNAEFGRIAGRVMHRPYWIPVPSFVLKLVLGEKSSLVLGSQRIIPQRLLETGYEYKFAELDRALEDLL